MTVKSLRALADLDLSCHGAENDRENKWGCWVN